MDLHFLEGEVQLVLSTQFFIHQHTNRNRQRLRPWCYRATQITTGSAFKCTDNGQKRVEHDDRRCLVVSLRSSSADRPASFA